MFSSNTSAVSADAVFVEDVMSCTLYTGNGSTQTITNGIDLSTKGGLVWTKQRSGVEWHFLVDTARGATNCLSSNATNASASYAQTLTAFNTTGYSIGNDSGFNNNGSTYVSWTFRKQAKFFDVVTYTGNGSTDRALAHSLNSKPGAIIIKRTDGTGDWNTWCRKDNTNMVGMRLNGTNAASTWGGEVSFTTLGVTTTDFNVGKLWLYDANYPGGGPNVNGETYVAYLFAHDAGGFGLTGTDNVISCGSVSVSSGGQYFDVNLGYEPQWLLIKGTDAGNWEIYDSMRGLTNSDLSAAISNRLRANLTDAENNTGSVQITSTGFRYWGNSYNSWGSMIYIAIRRGPMKTPTSGTSVFSPIARTGTGTNPTVVTSDTNPDLLMSFPRTASPAAYGMCYWDKLRGVTQMLQSANTNAETATSSTYTLQGWLNTGYQAGADFIDGYLNYSSKTYVNYLITRAPGFFDVVCYTGTGSARTVSHNLGVAPELMIVKNRNFSAVWMVYSAALGNTGTIYLNDSDIAYYSATYWNSTTPTSSVFSLGTSGNTNGGAGQTYVAYLFASCPGVSKVGSYTGTGTTLQIDCGFTGGARFVLIKRTDSTGDWYVWDSARGIVASTDPYLVLNSTAAEVTTTDWVDTYSAGFELSSAAGNNVNINAASYIFLSIA